MADGLSGKAGGREVTLTGALRKHPGGHHHELALSKGFNVDERTFQEAE